MNKRTRSSLVFGLLLILIGGWFLAVQIVPGLDWFWDIISWPMIVIGVGVFLLLLGLILGAPGMAIPACIVGGIGGLLYWQYATDKWETWSYAWALIPGFVGVGLMLASLLGEGGKENFRVGAWMSFISLIVFAVFGAFFGDKVLGSSWPILLILFGFWILIQPFLFRRRKKNSDVSDA
ncbi:MAG: hypothetical protein FJ010_02790 [Chloroflexi bacterium]|nr:hypothetical protein [Chloroflexota bacterium]